MMHRDRPISQVKEGVMVLYAGEVCIILNQIPVIWDVAQEHPIALNDQGDAQMRGIRQSFLGFITQEDGFVINNRFFIVFACHIQEGTLFEQATWGLVQGWLTGGENLIEDSKIDQEHERDIPKLRRVVFHSGHKETKFLPRIHVWEIRDEPDRVLKVDFRDIVILRVVQDLRGHVYLLKVTDLHHGQLAVPRILVRTDAKEDEVFLLVVNHNIFEVGTLPCDYCPVKLYKVPFVYSLVEVALQAVAVEVEAPIDKINHQVSIGVVEQHGRPREGLHHTC